MLIRSSHLAYGALLAGLGTLTVLGTLVSCASNPTVEVELTDPAGLRASAEYAQIVVFEGGCPPDEDLAYGRLKGYKHLQTTGVDGPFKDVGDLPKDKYGFAALLRQADCGVVAFGCTPVNLEHHRKVTIQVGPVSPPLGMCDTAKGESCNKGICSTATPSDGGTGEGGPSDGGSEADVATTQKCTMEVLAGSVKELAASTTANANLVGPVAVATDTGFIVTWLEWNADSAQLVRVPVDMTGAASAPVTQKLTECATKTPAPGITAAFNPVSKTGFTGVAWDACGGDGGTDPMVLLSGFDAKAAVIPSAQYFKEPGGPTRYQMVNGATAKPSDTSFLIAALQGGVPKMFTWDGVNLAFAQDVEPTFTTGPSTFVRVTETASIVGVVAEVDTVPQFWVGTPAGSLYQETLTPAKFAAVASWGDRALAVIPGDTGLSWWVRSANGNPVNKGKVIGGPFTAVGAVALHDSFAFIGAQPKGLRLYRFDNAAGTIAVNASSESPLNLGGTALTTFDGTSMSVAGSGNRVIITWLNSAGPLGEGKSPGGFALLKCDG